MAGTRKRSEKSRYLGIAALALLLTAAAPQAARLAYDPAALLDGACLAPAFVGSGCGSARPSIPTASFSAAAVGADIPPQLDLDLAGLLDWEPEVIAGSRALAAAPACRHSSRHGPERDCPGTGRAHG